MSQEKSRNVVESLFTEGTKLYEEKKFSEAETKLMEALQIVPGAEDIMYNLALVYLEQKRYDLAWEAVNTINHIDCKELLDELSKHGLMRSWKPPKSESGLHFAIVVTLSCAAIMTIGVLISRFTVELVLSSAVFMALCSLWLWNSTIHESRRWFLVIPGFILFLLASLFISLGLVTIALLSSQGIDVRWTLFLVGAVVVLFVSYFLCFKPIRDTTTAANKRQTGARTLDRRS